MHAHNSGFLFQVTILLLIASVLAQPTLAYQPNDPKVQAIVEKAVTYLERLEREHATPGAWEKMMGVQMLTAYAIYKHRGNRDHPKVQEALATAAQQLANGMGQKEVYELGVSISLLVELDDPQSRQLALQMYDRLLELQKPNGAFAYKGAGDTSLTQYALLGMWSIKEANLVANFSDVPAERACNWLLRTQGPAGNWAYHGKDSGSLTRVPQEHEASLSTFVAGAGSLYIAADILNFRKKQDSPFTSANAKANVKGSPTTQAVSHSYLWESLALADRFWASHQRLESPWQYYYMYGQERYLSVRNAVQRVAEPESGPSWYNDGVEYLERVQAADGSFKSPENPTPRTVDTALATLFLLRTTREKTHPPTSGVLRGSVGVEIDTQSNKVEDLRELIRALEDYDLPSGKSLKTPPQIETSQLDSLREKIKHPSYAVRLATVRVLSKGGLDTAPTLIYALSDPDNRIMQEARDALRQTSRKLQGFGLPNDADVEQKKMAQRKWTEWLRAIRPDLEF